VVLVQSLRRPKSCQQQAILLAAAARPPMPGWLGGAAEKVNRGLRTRVARLRLRPDSGSPRSHEFKGCKPGAHTLGPNLIYIYIYMYVYICIYMYIYIYVYVHGGRHIDGGGRIDIGRRIDGRGGFLNNRCPFAVGSQSPLPPHV